MNEDIKRQGFIKLYRNLLEWEWYQNPIVRDVFIHCLLKANFEPKSWQGIEIKRGQFVTSYPKLAQELNFTIMQIRNAINKLKLTGEITHKGHAKYSIITILQYDKWQTNNSQDNTQITDKQQTNNSQITSTKEYKNIRNKEIKNVVDDVEEKIYGDYNNVLLEKSDYQKLLGIALSQKLLDECINDLSENIAQGKEQPYKADFPQAHFVRIKNYIEYRRKHPTISKTHKIRGQENFEKSRMEAING